MSDTDTDTDPDTDPSSRPASDWSITPTERPPDGWRDAFHAVIEAYHDAVTDRIPEFNRFQAHLEALRDTYPDAGTCVDSAGHDTYTPTCTGCELHLECTACGDVAPIVRIEWRSCGDSPDEWGETHTGVVYADCDHCSKHRYCPDCAARRYPDLDPQTDDLTGPPDDPDTVTITSSTQPITLVEYVTCRKCESFKATERAARNHDAAGDRSESACSCHRIQHETPVTPFPDTAYKYFTGSVRDPDTATPGSRATRTSQEPVSSDAGPGEVPANASEGVLRGVRRGRGWSDEIVSERRLGWIPGTGFDEKPVARHLLDAGYTPEQLLATGLWNPDPYAVSKAYSDTGHPTEYTARDIAADPSIQLRDDVEDATHELTAIDLIRPRYSGRLLFPYFKNGSPVYAITRATPGRPHPDDYLHDNKYDKLRDDPWVYASEPIYGTDTLRSDAPAVITEGVADAIACHDHGIPTISPVTTQFKREHHDKLAVELDEADVNTVLIIQDNEPATVDRPEQLVFSPGDDSSNASETDAAPETGSGSGLDDSAYDVSKQAVLESVRPRLREFLEDIASDPRDVVTVTHGSTTTTTTTGDSSSDGDSPGDGEREIIVEFPAALRSRFLDWHRARIQPDTDASRRPVPGPIGDVLEIEAVGSGTRGAFATAEVLTETTSETQSTSDSRSEAPSASTGEEPRSATSSRTNPVRDSRSSDSRGESPGPRSDPDSITGAAAALDVDVFIVELPRFGSEKIDLDDYLSTPIHEYAPALPGFTSLRWAVTDTGPGSEAEIVDWLTESAAFTHAYASGVEASDALPRDWHPFPAPTADADRSSHQSHDHVGEDTATGTGAGTDAGDVVFWYASHTPYSDVLEAAGYPRDSWETVDKLATQVTASKFTDFGIEPLLGHGSIVPTVPELTAPREDSYYVGDALTSMSRATRLQVLDAPVDAVTTATETTAIETRDSRSLEPEDGGETRTGYGGESEITSLVPTPTIREPSATPGYSEWLRARGHAVTPTVETGASDDVSTDDTGTTTSRNPLYQFRLTDVAPVSNGYRGPNPLGHTGDSRDYFVMLDDEIAFDHKRKTAYNFLTYLAVEAGVRPVEHPNGSFSDAELLDVFIHAKRRGHLPDDAPAPLRVVKAAAFDLGIVTRDELTEKTIHTSNGETTLDAALPDAAYNQTVKRFESEYRVSPGRDPINTQ